MYYARSQQNRNICSSVQSLPKCLSVLAFYVQTLGHAHISNVNEIDIPGLSEVVTETDLPGLTEVMNKTDIPCLNGE